MFNDVSFYFYNSKVVLYFYTVARSWFSTLTAFPYTIWSWKTIMSYSLPISIRHFACSIDESIGTFQFGRTLSTPRSTASSTMASMAYCVVPSTTLVLTSMIFVCPADISSCIFRAVRVSIIEAPPYTALPVIVFICLLPPITTYECLILKIPITESQETIPIFTSTVDTEREHYNRQIVCMNNKKKSFKNHSIKFPFVEIPSGLWWFIYLRLPCGSFPVNRSDFDEETSYGKVDKVKTYSYIDHNLC